MDISTTTTPDSTQINAEDFLAGPRTVTITGVRPGASDQPVNIDLAEYPDRAFRPCKSMRRVLIQAWGADATAYVGRRMTLYRDAKVRFGGQDVGGIRISHMSHLDKRLTLALTTTRGKRAPYVVEPLPDAPPPITSDAAAEFERRITDAVTLHELDAIAADLKSGDLGTHRGTLLNAWKTRRAEVDLLEQAQDGA